MTDSIGSTYSDQNVLRAIRDSTAGQAAAVPIVRIPDAPTVVDCSQCELGQHERCQRSEQVIVDLGVNTWICCCEQGTETEVDV